MTEWDLFLRSLTLERHNGMARWRLTRAPERHPDDMPVWDDTPADYAARREVLESVGGAPETPRLRVVA